MSGALGSAVAQPAQPSADQRFEEAGKLFIEGGPDKALEVITLGLEQDPKHLALLRLRGEILLEKRDFEGALAAYENFLAAKPRGANRRKARKIVRDLRAVKTTFLTIKVNGEATIYVDSRTLGVFCTAKPECRKGMLPGSYELIIEREGFKPVTREVEVALNKEAAVAVALEEKPSALGIEVRPRDAVVEVDGKDIGAERQLTVPAGSHTVRFSLEGFKPEEVSVTAARGEPQSVAVTLVELVKVSVKPKGATLALDGNPVTLENGALAIPADGTARVLAVSAKDHREALVKIAGDRKRGAPIEIELEEIKQVQAPVATDTRTVIKVVSPNTGRKVAAGFLAGAATVGLGLGTYFGLRAHDKFEESKTFCDANVCSVQLGVDLVNEAQDSARFSNLAFASAGGLAVMAAFFWLTSQSDDDARRDAERELNKVAGSSDKPRATLRIDGGPDTLGLSFEGRF